MRQTVTPCNFVQEVLHYPQGKNQPPTEVVEVLRGLAAGEITIDVVQAGRQKSLVVRLASGEIIIYRLLTNMIYTTSLSPQSPASVVLFIGRLWLEKRPEFMKPFLAFLGDFMRDAESSATASAIAEVSQVLLPIIENELALDYTAAPAGDFLNWFYAVQFPRDEPVLDELTTKPDSTLSIAVDDISFLQS
jgi:hypothetical protein